MVSVSEIHADGRAAKTYLATLGSPDLGRPGPASYGSATRRKLNGRPRGPGFLVARIKSTCRSADQRCFNLFRSPCCFCVNDANACPVQTIDQNMRAAFVIDFTDVEPG
jgi:hypothetical protein